MSGLRQDLRQSLRTLARSPLFCFAVILALALGIGANSALFSLVDAVLLKPLAFHEPHELAMVWEGSLAEPGRQRSPLSRGNFDEWRHSTRTFQSMAAYVATTATLTSGGEPLRVGVGVVSPTLFPLLGVEIVQGRGFLPGEEEPGTTVACLVGEALWRSRFAADPEIVGSAVTLDDQICPVAGVVPGDLILPGLADVQIWAPLKIDPGSPLYRDNHSYRVVGRLHDGIGVSQASAEMAAFAEKASQEHPLWNRNLTASAQLLHEEVSGGVRRELVALFGAVAIVLFIACVNIAAIVLARAIKRLPEMAVRSALGAPRSRLLRLQLAEGLLLAVPGGVLGLGVAVWAVNALRVWGPDSLPRLQQIHVDSRVLLFTFAVTLATGIASGLLPAIRVTADSSADNLKGTRGSTGERSGNRLRQLLVTAQVALAVVLLVAAAMLLRSFWQLAAVNPGFQWEGRAALRIVLPPQRYREQQEVSIFYRRLLDRLRQIPGITAAGGAVHLPLRRTIWDKILTIEGRPAATPADVLSVDYNVVTPGYLEVMGMELIAGRDFQLSDDREAPQAALVNESFARLYFPGQDPLGHRIKPGYPAHLLEEGPPSFSFPYYTIVGVVRDSHYFGLGEEPAPVFYLPLEQHREGFTALNMVARVRTQDTAGMFSSLRRAVWDLDAGLAVGEVYRLEELLSSSVARPRFNLLVVGSFGLVALLLVAAGIYGALFQLVELRVREIGLRMALGAGTREITRWVLGQALGMMFAGAALGTAAALALSPLIESLVFQVKPVDVTIYLSVLVVLFVTALTATGIPARRAAAIHPADSLRSQ